MMNRNQERDKNRSAAVAGQFYPSLPGELSETVHDFFLKAKDPVLPSESPQALIVPHAGYVFSGQVAASAFKQLDGKPPKKVFVIASSHRLHFPGAAVYCSGDYETPLGSVVVDRETGNQLTRLNTLFEGREDAHLSEHSLEVQLPFLQVRFGNSFQLVPLILGTSNPESCREIAQTLQPWFTPENLFVFSSDFSHYPSCEEAIRIDRFTTEAILDNSPVRLLKTLKENEQKRVPGLVTSLCGWTSVMVLLYLTEGKPYRYRWIDYMNSGDQPLYGSRDRVVGYSAVAVFGPEEAPSILSGTEKEKLLSIAAKSVRSQVADDASYMPENHEITGCLAQKAGAFVSLYVDKKLRGCIGNFGGEENLAVTVSRVAASAVNDHRFSPVTEEEIPVLNIEISVLTPLKRIEKPEEIELGKHGIYIRKGWSSGTFLPQVATKYGWSREEFLGRCSRDKAGIGWDGWKTAQLFTYEAIVFSGKGTN